LIPVRELDAGGFEGQNDLRHRMTVRRLVSLRASDGVSMDASLFRQLADRKIEQAPCRSLLCFCHYSSGLGTIQGEPDAQIHRAGKRPNFAKSSPAS
jgi:hypothetical protein